MDKLREIGFYTLEDDRAKNVSDKSQLWRCELILTSRCNFKCPYCRGMKKEDQGDLSFNDARWVIDLWCLDELKNIRFSGGEPTLYKDLADLVSHAYYNGVERIAISTNGSADMSVYHKLLKAGVNDISISLDSCCASTGNKMAGGLPVWDKIIENIKILSNLTYVTVGVVITDDNIDEVDKIVELADELGVADIRLITSAQTTKFLPQVSRYLRNPYPILKYRLHNVLDNKPIRGINSNDNHKCPLVLDDMAVLNNKHYPCIIYLREQGKEIGEVGLNMRQERLAWYKWHDCYLDEICKNNCLDVCVDYNNRVRDTNTGLKWI